MQSLSQQLKFRKIGKTFTPDPQYDWMRSHAMLPTPMHLQGDVYRVYFSGRDGQNRSQIGFVEVDIKSPDKILRVSNAPVLTHGELGCFDDCGVTPSWIVADGDEVLLYYIGWKTRSSVRMGLVGGLAVSRDGGLTFQRYSRAPILRPTDREPFSIMTAPCVLKGKDGWQMWYVSGEGWETPDLPKYNIKCAQSSDGKEWRQTGTVCIELREGEYALARPCVVKDENSYRMWFSYKKDFYRIGYAESVDGIKWERKEDPAGLEVSPSGWDSQMIEYTYVFRHENKYYAFYNGNDYGKDGFGLAVEDPA